MAEICFFCNAQKDEESLVCSDCGRDTAIPAPLSTEHQTLLQKRDRLRAEILEAKAKLGSPRRKPIDV